MFTIDNTCRDLKELLFENKETKLELFLRVNHFKPGRLLLLNDDRLLLLKSSYNRFGKVTSEKFVNLLELNNNVCRELLKFKSGINLVRWFLLNYRVTSEGKTLSSKWARSLSASVSSYSLEKVLFLKKEMLQ